MGSKVGYIPAVVGGRQMELSPTGKVFEPTPENVQHFKEWMKYVRFDQGWVFTLGCFIGMGLPALLTVEFIAPGTTIGAFMPRVLITVRSIFSRATLERDLAAPET